jgi:hypothetical protein
MPRTMKSRRSIPIGALVIAGAACGLIALPVQAVTPDELEAKLQALTDEVTALRTELAKVKADQRPAPAVQVESLTPDATASAPVRLTAQNSGLTWSGYGQIDYARPTDNPSDTTSTVSRFVVGMSNQFDERTRLVSEVEIENTISSAEDPGEVEVEQLYVERRIDDAMFGKLGLFLIPSGLLNENHEPTTFYGVLRNRVETAIIPTTWREGGALVQATTEWGLRWDVGVTTGFDLSKWDPASPEGLESPLGSIHQELALAKASDLSGIAAVNYTGVPGLRLGASIFRGDASQGQAGFDDNVVTLWEAHGTWTPGRLEFAALYANGHISNTAKVNATFVGNPTLIPEDFFGWYVQAAYHLLDWETGSLRPFTRFERVNTASNYASIAPGLTPSDAPDQDIITTGVNFLFASSVVLKADYQHFDGDSESDQINLGLGYQF